MALLSRGELGSFLLDHAAFKLHISADLLWKCPPGEPKVGARGRSGNGGPVVSVDPSKSVAGCTLAKVAFAVKGSSPELICGIRD
jgi:hypothetical protein